MYAEALARARELWSDYRTSVAHHKTGKNAGGRLRAFFDFLPEFICSYGTHYGRPVRISDMASEICLEDYNTRPYLLNRLITERSGGVYDFLAETGVWERLGGEPLEHASLDGSHVLRSQRYSNVLFSHTGSGDVSWIPKISDGKAAYEASCIILFSGWAAQSGYRKSSVTQVVDAVMIKRRPYEMPYLEWHVIPLLSTVFGVPEEFFRHDNTSHKGLYGINYKPQLKMNSLMVGSFFQQVMGLFSVKDGRIVKTVPQPSSDSERKLFVRAATDSIGNFTRETTVMMYQGGESRLMALKKAMDEMGFPSSDVRPVLDETHRLVVVGSEGRKVLCKPGTKVRPNRKVLSRKADGTIEEVGEITGRHELNVIVELSSEPQGDLYQADRYAMHTLGGRSRARSLIEEVQPKNPSKLLRYLRSIGADFPVPTARKPVEELQEFVYKKWHGNVDELVAELARRD